MKFIKRSRLAFAFCISFLPFSLHAENLNSTNDAVIEFSRTDVISKPFNELKEAILDFENTCNELCVYHSPKIKEMSVLENLKGYPNILYSVYSGVRLKITKTETFHEVVVNEINPNEVTILVRYPGQELIEKLEEKYGLRHGSLFQQMDSLWQLKRIPAQGDESEKTEVHFSFFARSNSFIVKMFKAKTQNVIENSLQEQIDALRELSIQ